MAELKGSKTEDDLLDAFAGESQANRKYLAFAEKADQEGNTAVAKLFRAAAAAETVHTHAHLRALGGIHTTLDNLHEALGGETHAFTAMYPQMIENAAADGFDSAQRSYRFANAVEKVHAALYKKCCRSGMRSLGNYYASPRRRANCCINMLTGMKKTMSGGEEYQHEQPLEKGLGRFLGQQDPHVPCHSRDHGRHRRGRAHRQFELYMIESMDSDYRSANPPEAWILASTMDDGTVKIASEVPGVKAVEGRSGFYGRVIQPDGQITAVEFTAIKNAYSLTMSTLQPVKGETSIPPLGNQEVLIESTAASLGYQPADLITIERSHGRNRELRLAGYVRNVRSSVFSAL